MHLIHAIHDAPFEPESFNPGIDAAGTPRDPTRFAPIRDSAGVVVPRRTFCPKPFSKRDCQRKYLFLRKNLHALMVHLRARGHRAVVVKRDKYLFLGVEDEAGSLHMCSNNHEAHVHVRRTKKRGKPLFPLFTMWQEKRLVLLKGKPKGRGGLAHLR